MDYECMVMLKWAWSQKNFRTRYACRLYSIPLLQILGMPLESTGRASLQATELVNYTCLNVLYRHAIKKNNTFDC